MGQALTLTLLGPIPYHSSAELSLRLLIHKMKTLQHCSAAVRNGLKYVDKAFDAWDILRGFQGWGEDAGRGRLLFN